MVTLKHLIGHVGKDAEVSTHNGRTVVRFSVAETESYKDQNGQKKEYTTWWNCSKWGQESVGKLASYIKKGDLIHLEGRVSASAYLDAQGQPRASLDLTIINLNFLNSLNHGNKKTSQTATAGNSTEEQPF